MQTQHLRTQFPPQRLNQETHDDRLPHSYVTLNPTPNPVFHHSVLERLRHVLRHDVFIASEIRDGARNSEHAVVTSRAQAHLIHGSSQELPPFGVGTTERSHE